MRSEAAEDAACAAWFEVFRGADSAVVAKASRYLLGDGDGTGAVESVEGDERLVLMLWLS